MAQYEFGIASLLNKKELLQVGDPVQFQVHVTEDFAVNIQATREKLRSNVEAMKGKIICPNLTELWPPHLIKFRRFLINIELIV